ncbi:MAG TPA: DUF3097 family protein [Egibacteraceae bacterium]|nr:DUF3097 family protein [Egibacteraceae bacterium]
MARSARRLACRHAQRVRCAPPEVGAIPGLVAEHRVSGFSGEVVAVEAGAVVLRDWRGRERAFPLAPGAFLVDDRPATLVRPRAAGTAPRVTASGAIAAPRARARVAVPHRLFVEGVHDAELLEKVWGEELREAAVVVEPLHGADDLADAVRAFAPGPDRRLGILLDHLVPGSKEERLAARVRAPHVLVAGHPWVDVWQGVRPRSVGLPSWPTVPRGTDWKTGVCAALGAGDPPAFWRRLLGSVSTYADLEPQLVGAVERLLDFLIAQPSGPDG